MENTNENVQNNAELEKREAAVKVQEGEATKKWMELSNYNKKQKD